MFEINVRIDQKIYSENEIETYEKAYKMMMNTINNLKSQIKTNDYYFSIVKHLEKYKFNNDYYYFQCEEIKRLKLTGMALKQYTKNNLISTITYVYDYNGKFLYQTEDCGEYDDSYYRFETDYLSEAGTKFKLGDIVNMDFTGEIFDMYSELLDYRIFNNNKKYQRKISKTPFKIVDIPTFDSDHWSNCYSCETLDYNEEREIGYFADNVHETLIKLI